MIWIPAPEAKLGDKRVVRRFAWWPVTLINGHRLWLERYYATEEMTAVQRFDQFDAWEERAWRTISRTTFDPSEIIEATA